MGNKHRITWFVASATIRGATFASSAVVAQYTRWVAMGRDRDHRWSVHYWRIVGPSLDSDSTKKSFRHANRDAWRLVVSWSKFEPLPVSTTTTAVGSLTECGGIRFISI
jgi:hypothetical protein